MTIRGYTVKNKDGCWNAGCVRFTAKDVDEVILLINTATEVENANKKLPPIPLAKEKDVYTVRDGQWFCCMNGGRAVYGRISRSALYPSMVYMCSDDADMDGAAAPNMYGFEYSWLTSYFEQRKTALYDEDPSKTGELERYKERVLGGYARKYVTERDTCVKIMPGSCEAGNHVISLAHMIRLSAHVKLTENVKL